VDRRHCHQTKGRNPGDFSETITTWGWGFCLLSEVNTGLALKMLSLRRDKEVSQLKLLFPSMTNGDGSAHL
jgi:hypothetical protein